MLRGGYPCRKSGGIFAHGNCVLANFATLRIAEGYPQTIADRFRSPDRTLCADLISLGFLEYCNSQENYNRGKSSDEAVYQCADRSIARESQTFSG